MPLVKLKGLMLAGVALRKSAESPRSLKPSRRGVEGCSAGKEARNRGGKAGSLIAGEQIGPQATGQRARMRRKMNLPPGAPQHLTQVHGRIGSRPHKLSPVRTGIIQLSPCRGTSPDGEASILRPTMHTAVSQASRLAHYGLVEGGEGDFGSLPKEWTRHATAARRLRNGSAGPSRCTSHTEPRARPEEEETMNTARGTAESTARVQPLARCNRGQGKPCASRLADRTTRGMEHSSWISSRSVLGHVLVPFKLFAHAQIRDWKRIPRIHAKSILESHNGRD